MFNELERNMGLRLVTLNEVEDPNDELKSDPIKDIEVFQEVCEKTFHDFKKTHREVMGSLRTREHDTISKLGSFKPSESIFGDEAIADPYDRINEQVEKVKEKIIMSKQAQENYSRDSLSVAIEKKAMTFRDFYKAKPFDSDEEDDESSYDGSSEDSQDAADSTAQQLGASSGFNKGKRDLYER